MLNILIVDKLKLNLLEEKSSPVEVLEKYKDNPAVYLSFTSIIEPRQQSVGDNPISKKTNKLGVNPLSQYSTPIGIYNYPVKAFWSNIKNYNFPFANNNPVVWVFEAKNPERVIYGSTYTDSDYDRDVEILHDIFYPIIDVKEIAYGSSASVDEKFKDYYDDSLPSSYNSTFPYLDIDPDFRKTPASSMWALTRNIAYVILYINDKKRIQGESHSKTKHPTIWTRVAMQICDGFIDDLGKGFIHLRFL